jgi:hypothetical protein
MFPPWALTPRQFLADFTYRDLRVWNAATRERQYSAERAVRGPTLG